MNRVERKDGYCKLLLLPNQKQNLTDKYYAKVSAEDYNKIKKYDWRVYKLGGRLVAATYIGRDFTQINKLLFPDLKRLHRVNDDTLDYRIFNIKHFRNEKINETIKKEPEQETIKIKEETKMIAVTRTNYDLLENIKAEKGLEDQDQTISYLIDIKESYEDLWKPTVKAVDREEHNTGSCDCNNSFLDKLKAKLRIN